MELFMFEGQDCATLGQQFDVVCKIVKEEDKERAKKFMEAYIEWLRREGKDPGIRQDAESVARSNIGYLAGYADSETAKKIWEIFNVQHPIFGTTVPSPDEALEAGKNLAHGQKASK